MKDLFRKYSQGFALAGSALLLILIIFFGQTLLGDKGEVAALAGFITIFGVSANNLVQTIGRREREKAKREFEVRRDIYMEFAEAIAINWARLAKLLRFDIPEKDLQGNANAFTSAGHKIRLAGSQKTVECFEKLYVALAKFELSIRQERLALSDRIAERKQLDAQFTKNQETMTQITNFLQNMKPSGFFSGVFNDWTDEDKTRMQNLRAQHGALITQNTELSRRAVTLSQELTTAEKAFRVHYIEGITTIRPLITEIMISMRTELDVTVDETWFRKIAEATDTELSGEYRRAIDNARQKVHQLSHPA